MIKIDFLEISFLDIIDILLVTYLFYTLYKLLRGSIAYNIFIGLISLAIVWIVVRASDMKMISTILGQFMSVGALIIIIIFQQEIRKYLLIFGKHNILFKSSYHFKAMFLTKNINLANSITYDEIVYACMNMKETKTGALIVVAKSSELREYTDTGLYIDANVNSKLIENIFYKNNPLHDGAVIIVGNKIKATSCILPVSYTKDIPSNYGLRHRAAIGITKSTDASAIVVSEERGEISIAKNNQLKTNVSEADLEKFLKSEFLN